MKQKKDLLKSLFFLTLWFQCVVLSPTPKSYIRTSGKREKGLGITRIPERIEVASCLARCQQTPSCVCARISTTGNGVCETYTNTSNPNVLKTTGFVYYAADMYKKTLETESLALAKPSYQSSTYRLKNVKYTADRANDGNRNVEGFLQPYFAHTMDGPDSEPYPWWQVDMEEEYVITGIFILNRRNWVVTNLHQQHIFKSLFYFEQTIKIILHASYEVIVSYDFNLNTHTKTGTPLLEKLLRRNSCLVCEHF
ncbi:hypothetical protein HNY73_007731 [Argiope bruennichi]|uniref:Fucolectin tachylectin-4 pentraxin-1 domain-containing protein n=1 Tax=Argiope bruennichi TaxID=94029 RepID=A0A8T0FFS7_ARGBR|nr:hypothetical protein HNY73_007731 [Argiope bruennichi]